MSKSAGNRTWILIVVKFLVELVTNIWIRPSKKKKIGFRFTFWKPNLSIEYFSYIGWILTKN